MTPRQIADFLKDMIDAIDLTQESTSGLTFNTFEDDQKTIFAVSRAVEIIGEASKQIPRELREQYSHIPWKDIARMRDKMIHHYFGVNLKILWNTVNNDLPLLKPQLLQMLKNLPESTP
jgi:uncharacterized protein with HEPN domain